MNAFAAIAVAALLATRASADARITLDVRGSGLSAVLALLSSESGTNIIADGSVKDRPVTLRLQNVTVPQALDVLAQSYGLAVRTIDGVTVVGTAESSNRVAAGSPDDGSTRTRVFELRNADAQTIAKELAEALPPGTVLVADPRTRRLIVTAPVRTVERAAVLIAAVDAPARGEQEVETLSPRFVRPSDLAATLKSAMPGGSYVADDPQNRVVISGDSVLQRRAARLAREVDVAAPQVLFEVRVADVEPLDDQSNVGLQFGGYDLSGQPISGAATYAFAQNSLAINARINALVSEGHAQILATPKLLTLNNHEADLLIGETYPVVYYDLRAGGQQVQFVDIGVKLRLTPTIGADGSITAEIHPEYSAIETFVGGYPVLANRRVDSTLRVRNGETIVLGGLLREIDSETITRLPGLAGIPILGKVFQNRQRTRQRDEVVFLITPHVVGAP